MVKIFGTDGVRGIANHYPMTCEIALALGKAIGHKYCNQHKKVVIGKDTRKSSCMFEMAVASGVCSAGCDVLLVGALPTPAVAFLTTDMRADAGIMVSASHNSYEFNGIKVFGRDGFKLSRDEESELESLIVKNNYVASKNIGKMYKIEDARGRYNAFLKSSFPKSMDLVGIKIAIDCANGAAFKIAPKVLEELGAEVLPIGVSPNGENINYNCGSTNVEQLRNAVVEHKCNLGIALDGDADRLIMIDEMGNELDGDKILSIIAKHLKYSDGPNTIVCTTMSNIALDAYMNSIGVDTVRTDVGDVNVIQEMRRFGYRVGGEQSGHIILSDYTTTGDGMIAALMVLSAMKLAGKPMSKMVEFKHSPQKLINVNVTNKIKFKDETNQAIADAKKKLGRNGRVLVRYSGTEPKLRIMAEGPDEDKLREIVKLIADTVDW